jgi:pilus assembly protein Flp/PilA
MERLQRLVTMAARRLSHNEGQGLAEYALILALIAIIAIIALIFLGTQISSQLSLVGTSI